MIQKLLFIFLTCSTVILGVVSETTDWQAIVFGRHIIDKVWENGMDYEIDGLYGCLDQNRQDVGILHTEDVWRFLRYTYKRVVKGDAFAQGERDNATSGFQVAVRVVLNDKGRAVVAAEPIQTGSVVLLPTYSANFLTPHEFRRFLQALPTYLVCDVMMWAYARLNEEHEPRLCVDLDPSSLLNGGDKKKDVNLIPAKGSERFAECDLELVAMRDIAEGEELLIDYDFSEGHVAWGWIGMNDEEGVEYNLIQEYYDTVAVWHGRDEL
eukprot:Nitzschia sp. Nitz4//scaffold98_size77359//76011//76811//NITZ4_005561-RA/size77359-processed-gene-0.27-mRNA-1//1//CDS//3329560796//4597//frame0